MNDRFGLSLNINNPRRSDRIRLYDRKTGIKTTMNITDFIELVDKLNDGFDRYEEKRQDKHAKR